MPLLTVRRGSIWTQRLQLWLFARGGSPTERTHSCHEARSSVSCVGLSKSWATYIIVTLLQIRMVRKQATPVAKPKPRVAIDMFNRNLEDCSRLKVTAAPFSTLEAIANARTAELDPDEACNSDIGSIPISEVLFSRPRKLEIAKMLLITAPPPTTVSPQSPA